MEPLKLYHFKFDFKEYCTFDLFLRDGSQVYFDNSDCRPNFFYMLHFYVPDPRELRNLEFFSAGGGNPHISYAYGHYCYISLNEINHPSMRLLRLVEQPYHGIMPYST